MNLNRRHTDSRNGIAQGDAGMGIGGGVDDDDVETSLWLPESSPPVRLPDWTGENRFRPSIRRAMANFGLDVRQSRPAINFRFACAEQVQVRTVQKQHFHLAGII
jgi:hypothetical protein